MDKNTVELVHNQKSLGFYNQLFVVPKPNKCRPRSEQTKSFPPGREIQNRDTGNHQNIPPTERMGHLHGPQGGIFPYSNTGIVQEISAISCPGSDIPIQSTTLWSVHSTHGVHCDSKGGETDDHKDTPVPRRLVGESQIPPGLSPSYTGSSKNVSEIGLAEELR